MSFNSHDQPEWPGDYGTYPADPSAAPYPPRAHRPPRPAHRPPPTRAPSVPARADTELRRLRGAYRWLRRSTSLVVLAYFTGYLCMAAYLPEVMDARFLGNLNLGVFLGLLLIPLIMLTVIAYEIIARSTIDPAAHRVRIAEAEKRDREERR
jgi:uncharacterized membrane protein (DUF485 family)